MRSLIPLITPALLLISCALLVACGGPREATVEMADPFEFSSDYASGAVTVEVEELARFASGSSVEIRFLTDGVSADDLDIDVREGMFTISSCGLAEFVEQRGYPFFTLLLEEEDVRPRVGLVNRMRVGLLSAEDEAALEWPDDGLSEVWSEGGRAFRHTREGQRVHHLGFMKADCAAL